MNISQSMQDAIRWLVHSGIREANPERDVFGGFYQSYNTRSHRYDFIYSEITGYAISLLTNLFRWTGEKSYIDHATDAAEYLLRIQYKGPDPSVAGAFNYGKNFSKNASRETEFYSFDNAVCVSGLVDLYRTTKKRKYLSSAVQAAEWLIERAQYPDGSFRSVYDKNRKSFVSKGLQNSWYHDRACLHGKNIIGLLKLYSATRDRRFERSALKLADWVLGIQNPDGSFRTSTRHRYVFTHAHCYASEGLLFAYWATKLPEYKNAIIRSGNWLLTAQTRGGGFNEYYDKASNFGQLVKNYRRHSSHFLDFIINALFNRKRSDVAAQAARIWVLLHQLTGDPEYLNKSKISLEFIASLQSKNSSDPNAEKGFFYSGKILFNRLPSSNLMTSWSCMFAIHAFHLMQVCKKGGFDANITELF